MLMEYVWKYKRRPKREEVEWYQFLHGKHRTFSFFTKINQKRIMLKNVTKQKEKAAAKADYKAAVETGDFRSPKYKAACEILDYIAGGETTNRLIKTLRGKSYETLEEKHNSLHENYKVITGPLMNSIAYPRFLSSVWAERI